VKFTQTVPSASSSPCQALQVQQQRVYAEPQAQLAFPSRALKSCIETHACAPRSASFMPTRLVHVQVVCGKLFRSPRHRNLSLALCHTQSLLGPQVPFLRQDHGTKHRFSTITFWDSLGGASSKLPRRCCRDGTAWV
jgi:hypothetical protein